MKHLYVLLFLLWLSVYNTSAQPFTSIPHPFPAIGRCAVAFADIDNDNDLDVIMAGQNSSYNPICSVFENIDGQFVVVNTDLKGLYNCALSVADYDHDLLMDFIITGQNGQGNKTYLYHNNGLKQFMLTDSTMYGAGADGDVAFGDYDNDGYADLILSGNWQSAIYHNNTDGTFSETQIVLPGFNSPSVAWGDCDNDGDQDLIISGDSGMPQTVVLKNDSGKFTDMHANIDGAVGGDACFGDYDMDGVLDVLITGKDSTLDPVSFIFRNKGENYINASAGFVGTALGPADFIDYDNDGDPDVLLGGQNATCGISFTRLYNNDGIGGYSEFPAGLAFAERSASAWGDYDNDGDQDLLFAGISGNPVCFLYRNDLRTSNFQANTTPSTPAITDVFVFDNNVVINWERSSDVQTPSEAITYNLRVGTTPGGIDILSPNANTETGARYLSSQGNQASNTFSKLKNLEAGTYYFALQAIDQSFSGSQFSSEQTFTILPTGLSTHSTIDDNFSVTCEESTIHISVKSNDRVKVDFYNTQGCSLYSTTSTGPDLTIPVDILPKGLYILSIETTGNRYSRKIVLQ